MLISSLAGGRTDRPGRRRFPDRPQDRLGDRTQTGRDRQRRRGRAAQPQGRGADGSRAPSGPRRSADRRRGRRRRQESTCTCPSTCRADRAHTPSTNARRPGSTGVPSPSSRRPTPSSPARNRLSSDVSRADRALPRDRTVLTSLSGVHGRPTLVNNVETLAHVALIARYGPEWFRSVGDPADTRNHAGHPVGSVASRRARHGGPDRNATPRGAGPRGIDDLSDVRAVLIGGYHGSWIPADALTRSPAVAARPGPVRGQPGRRHRARAAHRRVRPRADCRHRRPTSPSRAPGSAVHAATACPAGPTLRRTRLRASRTTACSTNCTGCWASWTAGARAGTPTEPCDSPRSALRAFAGDVAAASSRPLRGRVRRGTGHRTSAIEDDTGARMTNTTEPTPPAHRLDSVRRTWPVHRTAAGSAQPGRLGLSVGAQRLSRTRRYPAATLAEARIAVRRCPRLPCPCWPFATS